MIHEKVVVLSDGAHQVYHVWDGTEVGLGELVHLVRRFYVQAEQDHMGATIHISRRVYHISLMERYIHVASLVTDWPGVSVGCTAFPSAEWLDTFEQHIHFTPAVKMARAVLTGRYFDGKN